MDKIEMQKRSMLGALSSLFVAQMSREAPEIELDVKYINNCFATIIDRGIEEVQFMLQNDPSAWAYHRDSMMYDVYLDMRRGEGTLTDYDLIRPKIPKRLFVDEGEYHKHMSRVSAAAQKINETGEEKQCSVCNEIKPSDKFKRHGGGVCMSCRSKAYRDSLRARKITEGEQE